MKKATIAYIVFIFFSINFTISAQNNLDQLKFLEGTWKVENQENYETWKLINDKSFQGSVYKIIKDKKIVSEELSIDAVDNEIFYHAKVFNQNNGTGIAFILNKEVKNKFSFEKLSHSFPKKIQYTPLDNFTVFVEVLGDKDKGYSFKMTKQ